MCWFDTIKLGYTALLVSFPNVTPDPVGAVLDTEDSPLSLRFLLSGSSEEDCVGGGYTVGSVNLEIWDVWKMEDGDEVESMSSCSSLQVLG